MDFVNIFLFENFSLMFVNIITLMVMKLDITWLSIVYSYIFHVCIYNFCFLIW